jgi:phage internal scaffolding protein
MEFKTAYGPKLKVKSGPYEKSRTKQSFKAETNVNFIVERYQRTGAAEHLNVHQGQYGEYAEIDYHSALNAVLSAQQMFESLPSNVRNRFDNNPGDFLAFASNGENHQEMVELGLAYGDGITPSSAADEVPSSGDGDAEPA